MTNSVKKLIISNRRYSEIQADTSSIDLFHIGSAHACIGHMSRDFSIIGETLHRWANSDT